MAYIKNASQVNTLSVSVEYDPDGTPNNFFVQAVVSSRLINETDPADIIKGVLRKNISFDLLDSSSADSVISTGDAKITGQQLAELIIKSVTDRLSVPAK